MNDSFKQLITYSEAKLRRNLVDQDVASFSSSLTSLYPLVAKFYPSDTLKILGKAGFSKMFAQVKATALSVVEQCTSYEIQQDKILLYRKTGEVNEYPILNPADFVKNGFKISADEFGFFLNLSFLISPTNYDVLQLFGTTIASEK
jgi:hypothetical protein